MRYRVKNIKPEIAEIFLRQKDIDMVPTWTQNPDGTLRLEICLDCQFNMGPSLDVEEDN